MLPNSISNWLLIAFVLCQDNQAVKSIQGHKAGKKVTAPDGSITFAGVCGMKLDTNVGTVLVTGGADGVIRWWNVSSGFLSEAPIHERYCSNTTHVPHGATRLLGHK